MAEYTPTTQPACEHCPDGHENPESRPWGVFVALERDGDGQPTHLYVAPTAGQHVAESDAEWARARLNMVDEAALRERIAQDIEADRTPAPWNEGRREESVGHWLDSRDATKAARIARGAARGDAS